MIRVIDNIISEKYSLYLFDQITRLKWSFVPNISYGRSDDYSSCGFSYNFFLDERYSNIKSSIITEEYSYVVPLLLEAFDKFSLDCNIEDVFRCRARLTLNKEKSISDDKHVDYSFPHLVLLYYINNTDGDTLIYTDNSCERISPKRGRCVLFDGSLYHSSSSSTLSPRLVLNTNLNVRKHDE